MTTPEIQTHVPLGNSESRESRHKKVSQIPMLSQRILGSPGGKHCKSLEGNVWRKVASSSKAVIWGKE